MESKCLRFVKCLLIFINTFVMCCGIALLGLGIWIYVNGASFRQLVSSNPAIFNAVAGIIAVGGFLVVCGFFGCAGAIAENKCLLGTYFTILLIILIAEVVMVVLILMYYPNVKTFALKSMHGNSSSTTTVAWGLIQSSMKCCGFRNASDWTGSYFPTSCCSKPVHCSPTSPYLHRSGCEKIFQRYYWVLGGVGIGVMAFEILSMLFACCLFRSLNRYEAA